MAPEGWKWTTVGQLGAPGKPAIKAGPFGSALKKEFYVPSGFKVYGQEQVIAKDPFFGDYFIDENKYLELRSCAVEPGDILLSLVGTVGRVLLLPERAEPGIINPRLLRISLDKRRVHGPFIAHYLESDLAVGRLESWAQGGTMGVLNAQLVRNLPVPLPPLEEQRQIARILDTWDAAIRAVDKVIAAKRERKRGLMQVLLTGRKRFKGFVQPWKTIQLGEVLSHIGNGLTYDTTQTEGVKVTRIETISDGSIDISRVGFTRASPEIARYRMQRGDILFSHINSLKHIGRVAFFDSDEELFHGMNLLLLRANEQLIPKYLYYLLLSDEARRHATRYAKSAVNQASINISEVRQYTFTIPTIAEQQKICSVLETADAEAANLGLKLVALQRQKRGLMQQLLTGKKRAHADVPEVVHT